MVAMGTTTVSFTPAAMHIEWADGARAEFASIWLRDNRVADRDATSGQRLVDIADIPDSPRIRGARLDSDAVVVEWDGEGAGARFGLNWLREYAPGTSRQPSELSAQTWLDGSALDARRDFAWLPAQILREDARHRFQWMSRLVRRGIAFLSGVPSEALAILDAVAPLGFVIDTNYGRVFDVRSVPQPENLAYSDLGLGLHTDNPYREPVPGFQALHCLVASREGGDNLFADGFALAEHMRTENFEAFAVLARTPVPFLYRSKDAELFAERPLLELSARGEIRAVNYNNRSIAPLALEAEDTVGFYSAYRRFAKLLRETRYQMRTRLDDGDLVVFDNRRILHGRTAFSSARYGRHLQGCYLTRDSVVSETGVLRRRFAKEGPG